MWLGYSIFFTYYLQTALSNCGWEIFSMSYLVLSYARFQLQCLNKLQRRILDPVKSVMEPFSQCSWAVKLFSEKSIIIVALQGPKTCD